MPSVINSGKPIVPEASSVCRPPNTCRAPARHSSAARPTFVRRAPFNDFAVSNHETRSEQSLGLLPAFIGFEPTFRSAWTEQSMRHNGIFVVLVPVVQHTSIRYHRNFGRRLKELWPKIEGTFSAELTSILGQSSFVLWQKCPHSSVKVNQRVPWKRQRH